MHLKKVLIANRGEIASRIIETCKRLGIQTVAIYSEADKEMPFVKEADEAYLIGPPPVQQSYLKAKEIIEIALHADVEGIHPGYGLLSENADFARSVAEAGMTFIGPEADTIRKMGDKIEARKTMEAAGVPVVPGSDGGIATVEEAKRVAASIGYPVMLKASAGGGGVGMVRCEDEASLNRQFAVVRKKAEMYFGDGIVFLEKLILDARHIEVQVFADHSGRVVHLFERNCSVQRRHQKVIEEAPSPQLSEKTRNRLFEAAVKAAKAVRYRNAGTVEFIVDDKDQIYFLEMNTRLQVEHPVTEAVTGYDLVEWQIEVAKGNGLPISDQEAIKLHGHAIEFRVYAEHPDTFMPSPGLITKLDWGQVDGIRIDTGYVENGKVTPFYDPLLAKAVVHAETREEAIRKSATFLPSVAIEGVSTNIPLLSDFTKSELFKSGTYTTEALTAWNRKQKGEK